MSSLPNNQNAYEEYALHKDRIIDLWNKGHRDESSKLMARVNPSELKDIKILKTFAIHYFNVKQFKLSASFFRRAVELNPQDAPAYVNLGAALRAAGFHDKALHCYERALAIDPKGANVYSNMGNAYKSLKQYAKAEEAFKKGLQQQDGDYESHYINLAALYLDTDKFDKAYEVLESLLMRQSNSARAYAYYARGLTMQGFFEEANIFYRKSLALNDKDDGAWMNYSQSLKGLARMDESVKALEKCLELSPKSEYGHYHMGLFCLLKGDLKRGFKEYQWRWRVDSFPSPKRPFKQPYWIGQDLENKQILIYGEQGVGEEIMFSHMVKMILGEKPSKVYLESDHRLLPLLQRTYPEVEVFTRKVNVPPHTLSSDIDYYSAAGSLGRAFLGRFNNFPDHDGYLVPDADRAKAFKELFDKQAKGKLKIGIAWKSLNQNLGGPKTIQLPNWQKIVGQDAFFIRLQYGDCTKDLADLKEQTGLGMYEIPDLDTREDLDGLAAAIQGLDLVITTSNVTAHLAGGLGIPCWTLLPYVPLWHWFLEREDSPWYPSMLMFRQSIRNDWSHVLKRIEERLTKLLAGEVGLDHRAERRAKLKEEQKEKREPSVKVKKGSYKNKKEALVQDEVALTEVAPKPKAVKAKKVKKS